MIVLEVTVCLSVMNQAVMSYLWPPKGGKADMETGCFPGFLALLYYGKDYLLKTKEDRMNK